MESSISLAELQAYYESDNLEDLYKSILTIYRENTNGNELEDPLKHDLQQTILYAPDLETIIERLEGLIATYQQYFHK